MEVDKTKLVLNVGPVLYKNLLKRKAIIKEVEQKDYKCIFYLYKEGMYSYG